ncbi:unnamed protein product, partial [Schistosoma margrebowiei]
VNRRGRVEVVNIDRLKPAHVDDISLPDKSRLNARPDKPTSGIAKSTSDHTIDTSETSFSRPSQQHVSSSPPTNGTSVSRPDQQTTPLLTHEPTPPIIARLVLSTSVNLRENWPNHLRSCQHTQLVFWL